MAKLTAKTDIDDADRKFRRVASTLERELADLVEETAEDSEMIFSAHALKATGRMSRGMSHRTVGATALIRVDAVDPNSGFDYVAVTRFGHRKARIYPTRVPKADRFYPKSAKAFHLPGIGFRRSIKGFAALKTPFGYRRSVRGFKPTGDWAARALPQVEANAERTISRLGVRITARLS